MRRQEKIEKASAAVRNCINGDTITDEELKCGLEFIEEMVQFFDDIGDKYYLIAKELKTKRNVLEEFKRARRWDRR